MVQTTSEIVNFKKEQKFRPEQVGGVSPLPCLYNNNSIEIADARLETVKNLTSFLSPNHKKQAHNLYVNVERLINEAPSIGHIGFLTLTFADHVTDYKESSRRLNSFKNYLRKSDHFGKNITVIEAQKSGRLHYHLIVELKEDIRTGVNFDEFAKKRYRSASPYLNALWAELREVMPKYGFGRHELLPIKSNAEAMGRYVGKYVSKHIGCRDEDQKGMRLINYSRGWLRSSANFAWYTNGSKKWRRNLEYFAKANGCDEFYQLHEKLGVGWAYKYADEIANAYENYGLNVAKGKPKTYTNATIHALTTNATRRETKKAAIDAKGYFAGKADRESLEKEERQKAYGRRQQQESKALVGSIIERRKAEIEEARRESEKQLKEFLKDPLWVRAKRTTPSRVPF